MDQKNPLKMTPFQPFLNTSIKLVAYLMHHLACHHWSNILGSSGQRTTQKQLKMIVSAGRKAFENLKLENYIFDVNKNYQVGIPL